MGVSFEIYLYYYNSTNLLYFFKSMIGESLHNKWWSNWEDQKEIFGHDRVNGLNVVDILEAINTVDGHDNIRNMGVDGTFHVILEDILKDENVKDIIPNDAMEDT